jgi:acyl carrier protein
MVETAVFEVIANHINRQTDVITLDSELKDLGVDSLGAITILYELEERFDIEIPNEVIESINNVRDIVNHLELMLENR